MQRCISCTRVISLLRYGISGADAVASPVSAADDSDRSDLDATAEFSEGDKEGGEDAFGVPRNLHSAPAMRRTDASPMRFSFPDESFENSPSVQRPAQTTVRIRSTETVVTGGVNAEQYTLYHPFHCPFTAPALCISVTSRHPLTNLSVTPSKCTPLWVIGQVRSHPLPTHLHQPLHLVLPRALLTPSQSSVASTTSLL